MTVIHHTKQAFLRALNGIQSIDMEPFMMRVRDFGTWTAKALHIRQRYIFTKENKLRLRYVASGFCLLFATSIFTLTLSQNASSLNAQTMASLSIVERDHSAADAAASQAQRSLTNMLDSRLYGKFSLASASVPSAIARPKDEIVKIRPGDALGVVLQNKGVGKDDVNKTIDALSKHYNPRNLKAGQEIAMHFKPTDQGDYRFMKMKIEVDPIKAVVVERHGDNFKSELFEKPVERIANAKSAKVELSLFGSAGKAGIPKGVVADVIRIYSWDVDFQRDIRQGDGIEVLYDTYETPDGHIAKKGDLRYAKLTVDGDEKPIYRFKMSDGRIDYFTPDGVSIKKTLMKTPVDGARISSGFGMRKHPILGYNKMHKGVDFAAPRGTPIYAAGDGVVERASRNGAYGHYVRIRHNSKLKTAYAHLHRYKSGIKPGKRVKQGQVIGYVGSTGRSTGPHLHYEVIMNGKQVNPRSVNVPTGEELTGKDLAKFKDLVRDIDREYANVRREMEFADKRSHRKNQRYN
ncbi:MAG: peptidoglycan DD-metalloendopeptidase family protein [Pseudomonadota bacterium]